MNLLQVPLKESHHLGYDTPLILSDIISSEDALGDKDFKVVGNETGITVYQMDLKTIEIMIPIMKQALAQERKRICHILIETSKRSLALLRRLSMYAPSIYYLKI
ncbi:hypothetical protein SUGI_0884770 [Cryptomeria japonica]|nr:hypothetical protein SUGI_0884770 [Cryptomeria japonica]